MLGRLVPLRTQLLAALSVSVSYLVGGMVRAWASPGVPSLRGNSTHFDRTWELSASDQQLGWIISLSALGAMVGGMVSSFPLHWLGRKYTLLLAAVIYAASFSLQGASYYIKNTEIIMAVRFFSGFAVGLSIPASQLYLSECTESSIRGTLSLAPAVFMALGILMTYAVAIGLPWHYLSFFCTVFPVFLVIAVIFLPRSPMFLMAKGHMEKGRKALQWFRPGQDIDKEYNLVREHIERAHQLEVEEEAKKSKKFDLSEWHHGKVIVPLFISMALMVFQMWSGFFAIIFRTVDIFAEVKGGPDIEAEISTLIVGIVQFFATFLSIFLVDHAGRRPMLLLSGVIMAVGLYPVAVYFQLKAEAIAWMPLAGIIVFMIGYSVGYAAIPYVIMGELFPSKQRNVLAGISSSVNLICLFLVVKLFDDVKNSRAGIAGNFWIYGSVSAVSCVVVYFFLPETKGKTLAEIESHFHLKHHKEKKEVEA